MNELYDNSRFPIFSEFDVRSDGLMLNFNIDAELTFLS